MQRTEGGETQFIKAQGLIRTGQVLFKLTSFNNYPLGDGLREKQVSRASQFK